MYVENMVIADFPFKRFVWFIFLCVCVKYCLNNSEDDLQRLKWQTLKPETGMSWIQYMTPQNMSDCSCPKSKITWLQMSSDMISDWYFCDVFWLSLQFYSKGFTFILQGTDYGSWTAKHRSFFLVGLISKQPVLLNCLLNTIFFFPKTEKLFCKLLLSPS